MYQNRLAILIMAVLLDLLLGDPRVPYHPVALVGRMISRWERLLYREDAPAWRQRLAGVCFALVNILPVVLVVFFGLRALERIPVLYAAVSVFLLWSTIAVRSLDRAGREIFAFLEEGDLAGARLHLGLIVGRDTDHLDEGEITRATVETIAENVSDGIIAPLFYFLIGGVPLACAYRAVNTLDSMVGYKNERYLNFGWFSARLDDLANYLPARLTALLLLGGALVRGLNWRRAALVILRDARKHPSPNSGYPEAAVAGALGVRLGGTNYYQGVPSQRPYLGDACNPLEHGHIKAALELMHWAVVIFLAFFTAGWFVWYGAFPGGRIP
ncbi:MAG TPA: cobalamin biosynthesis protein CobD [Syntrophomonadaceae bacterium]|nr:cobalamin biosynthesis protein CobD [Syntrophomonadaceae bacterium]